MAVTPPQVEGELVQGERLLWTGHPDPNKLFMRGDVFLVPFSLFWSGITTAAVVAWILEGGWAGLLLVPFVLIGFYLLVGRFIHKAWRRRRTTYAVTDRRVLVVLQGPRRRTVLSMLILAVPDVKSSIRPDGSGTVVFGGSLDDIGGLAEVPEEQRLGFYDIRDARYVNDLVTELRARPRESSLTRV